MIRECFQARPGKIFIQADFPQLELYTLAQVCYTWLGQSALGDMLKAGIDPHTQFASKLAKCAYEEGMALKDAKDKKFTKYRQIAKAFNFGKPGGLGPKKLVDLAATPAYGRTVITEAEARRYGTEWFETFPEMRLYFERVNQLLGGGETGTVVLPFTGFVRGGAKYCALCNTPFQGLGAACAKRAMWYVAKAQYTETQSPLFGSRTVAMVHDELIGECDEAACHDAAFELGRLMTKGANEFLPDVPIVMSKMEPTAMRFWSKEATQVFDQQGRLIPWEGKKAA